MFKQNIKITDIIETIRNMTDDKWETEPGKEQITRWRGVLPHIMLRIGVKDTFKAIQDIEWASGMMTNIWNHEYSSTETTQFRSTILDMIGSEISNTDKDGALRCRYETPGKGTKYIIKGTLAQPLPLTTRPTTPQAIIPLEKTRCT